jgi:hypothetical protein
VGSIVHTIRRVFPDIATWEALRVNLLFLGTWLPGRLAGSRLSVIREERFVLLDVFERSRLMIHRRDPVQARRPTTGPAGRAAIAFLRFESAGRRLHCWVMVVQRRVLADLILCQNGSVIDVLLTSFVVRRPVVAEHD